MKLNPNYKFGDVTVPNGKKGPWTISEFEIKDDDLLLYNLRAARDNGGLTMLRPGMFKRLTHSARGCVMSNTHMERNTNWKAYNAATGRVLINGLGLGMLLEGLLHKPEVTYVRVIEVEQDVIDLVGPHFDDPRVEIVQANAYEYVPEKGAVFDYAWHDIWDDLSADNFPLMAKLTRKYARRAEAQGVWSRDEVRRLERRA